MKSILSYKSISMMLVFMLTININIYSQDCYTKGRDNGIAAYNKGDYKEALAHFDFALNVCDDAPADNDIADWIKKCNRKQEEYSRTRQEASTTVQRSTPVTGESESVSSVLQSIYDNMVHVEGGTFMMGSNDSDADDDENPVHQVTVGSFSISRYEVTQKHWKAVMGSNPSSFKGDNLPVESVSWTEVQRFITKLNQLTGKRYRLPTEAEWEFAARGGKLSNGYIYAGSNSIGSVAWYDDNSSIKTHPVGQKQANELGLYDMSGNVWEWCSDWYGEYLSTSQTNPKGASSGSRRVYRGGSWNSYVRDCRVSYRNGYVPGGSGNDLGFRLCL